MRWGRAFVWVVTVLGSMSLGGIAFAQDPGAAATDAAAPADTAVAAPVRPAKPARASWTSDRLPLRVGDLLTIVVDERTMARERFSTVATAKREMRNGFSLNMDTGSNPTTMAGTLNSGADNSSRDVGEAGRSGDLTAVVTVRVESVEPNGVARVTGNKKVTVDGRLQEVTLTGLVRAEDVSARNLVSSDRIAEANITLKGKKIGPRKGMLGGLIGMIWP